ncbi:MAG: diacylglycerol kinase [PVC group bacterium]
MVPHKLIDSFNAAVEGIVYVLKTQRNMRIHFVAAALVLILSITLKMAVWDLLFLLSAIVLVLLTEMVNTAIELTIDLIKDTYHPLARAVKDVGAGAVFIVSLYAVCVGYLVFFKKGYLLGPLTISLEAIRGSDWHLAFVSLAVVAILTVIVKVLLQRGTPFRGGLPSVHAAASFSIFALTALIPETPPVIVVLVFCLAFLVAQSRIASRVHSISEVVFGALWGMSLTYVLYKLFT